MKEFLIAAACILSIGISLCPGTDKTNCDSDTNTAKGSGGAANTTQSVQPSDAAGGSAAPPQTTDTRKR